MTQTTTPERPQNLVRALMRAAEQTEARSRRNGWDIENQSSVYPGGELVDALRDIRGALADTGNHRADAVVDKAPTEYGRRPGACTTAEVRALCGSPLEALTNPGTHP